MGTQRVITGVSGSVRSLAALREATTAARSAEAELVPVLAWAPAGGELAYIGAPCPILLRCWHDAAWLRLRDAFDAAFGGMPDGLVVHPRVARAHLARRSSWRRVDRMTSWWWAGGGWRRVACTVHGAVRRYCFGECALPGPSGPVC